MEIRVPGGGDLALGEVVSGSGVRVQRRKRFEAPGSEFRRPKK